jgi:hypothetical protein
VLSSQEEEFIREGIDGVIASEHLFEYLFYKKMLLVIGVLNYAC